MTTKRELERLARKALGKDARVRLWPQTAAAGSVDEVMSILCSDKKKRLEMLAAALRGVIAWKEGKR